jgi:ClpP class serine protease
MTELKIKISSDSEFELLKKMNIIQNPIVTEELKDKLTVAKHIHEEEIHKIELYRAIENAKKRWIIENVSKSDGTRLDKIISERLLYQKYKNIKR